MAGEQAPAGTTMGPEIPVTVKVKLPVTGTKGVPGGGVYCCLQISRKPKGAVSVYVTSVTPLIGNSATPLEIST